MDNEDTELFTLSFSQLSYDPAGAYPIINRQDYFALAVPYRIVAIHLAACVDVGQDYFASVAVVVGSSAVQIGISQNVGIVANFAFYNLNTQFKSDWIQVPRGGIFVPASSPVGLYFGAGGNGNDVIGVASLYMVKA